MLDSETHVFHRPEEPVRVHMQEEGSEVVLYFADLSGEGDVLRLEINPRRTNDSLGAWPDEPIERLSDCIDPAVVRRVGRNYATYVEYARSVIRWDREKTREALGALGQTGKTRRGLSTTFLSGVAAEYRALVANAESAPIKTLSEMHHVTISAASRWVKMARERGLLEPKGDQR